MLLQPDLTRCWKQIRGKNPFDGDCLPTRVDLLRRRRPTLPFPHSWNYTEPIRILETFYCEAEEEEGFGRHNRYLDVPGLHPVLVTRDPGMIRAILSATGDKPGQFDRDTRPAKGIARATGKDSLLYANGSQWRRQKKMAAPPFTRSKLFQPERFHDFEQTFRKTIAARLEALRLRQQATGQKVIRIRLEDEIKVVMLEMLINNFFGADIAYEELRDRFVPAIELLIEHMVRDTVTHFFTAPFKLFADHDPALEQARVDFELLTDIALSGRAEGRGSWSQFKSDVDDDALRSNIRVFLAGALEATTSFASWAVSHLSYAPEIQDQIYEEVKDMQVYDPENLAQAVTLRRVMDETLRLTPSLYFLPRRATADTWVETADQRKMLIPQGTHVLLDVWHANRCEEFWGQAVTEYPAEVFAPDRWAVLERQGRSPKEFLHFGFGYGPRVCPGISLGLLEVGLVVGAIVKVFKFRAVRDETRAKAGVSTKPADGALVDLELRPVRRTERAPS